MKLDKVPSLCYFFTYKIMSTITIRVEEEKDRRRCEELARDAFWDLYIPGAVEHALVHQMRGHHDMIADLSLVIEVDGQVEGAIYYTKSSILQADGTRIDAATFGPVFINPSLHRQGLGRILITSSLEKAIELGIKRVLILGFPYHYRPYGFIGAKKYGISMSDGNFYTGLQALELEEGALKDCVGVAEFSSVYDEFNTEEAELFDVTFPARQKNILACQKLYEASCVELDVNDYIND